MTSLRQYFPANRLANAMATARPLSVEQCLRQADDNLRHIAIACRDHLDRSLELLESRLGEWPQAPNPDYVASLYQMAVRMIGVASTAGLPALDEAAASLSDVLDAMQSGHAWERAPVEVHVRSMRLLREPGQLPDGGVQLSAGLAKVRQRYKAVQSTV